MGDTQTAIALKKRSYGQITGVDDLNKISKLRRIEQTVIAKYIYGSDHQAICARFFVQDGMMELEEENYGSLMFRLDTGAESPRNLVIGLFILAMVCKNVCASAKSTLAAIYTSGSVAAALAWLKLVLSRLHEACHVLGCVNSATPGGTCLINCVMRGNSYNDLKTKVYPLIIPKDMFISLEDDDIPGEVMFAYLVFIYECGEAEIKPAVYILVSSITYPNTLIDFIRFRFHHARIGYIDRLLERPNGVFPHVGVVRRLGWCLHRDIKNGVVARKGLQLSVKKLENFYVDIGDSVQFL